MTADPFIAEIAALIGDPARANMLTALMGGQALTATELAYVAHVAPSTASGHLAKLLDGRLVAVATQGRNRYYRLASRSVAAMLESMILVAAEGPPRHRPRSIRNEALIRGRTCYDHIAGKLGVALADALCADGQIAFDADGGVVTEAGWIFLKSFGVELGRAPRNRIFCKPCLDWSERRWHVGGALGTALAARLFALGWIERDRDSRAVTVPPRGREGFQEAFGIAIAELDTAPARPFWTWSEPAGSANDRQLVVGMERRRRR